MQFARWLENVWPYDTWASVQSKPADEHINTSELYELQSKANKDLMGRMRKSEDLYINNLRNSIDKTGMKTPIQVREDMQIYDGLHRLICAIDLKIPTVPIKFLPRS